MGSTSVTTWHLEQRSPDDLRPAAAPGDPVRLVRAEVPLPELSRFLYATVGAGWWWYVRLPWTRGQAHWCMRGGLDSMSGACAGGAPALASS